MYQLDYLFINDNLPTNYSSVFKRQCSSFYEKKDHYEIKGVRRDLL